MSGTNNASFRRPANTTFSGNSNSNGNENENENNELPTKDPPFTRAKARAQRLGLSGADPLPKAPGAKKRGRKSDFTIFTDINVLNVEGQSTPKKARADARVPLFTRLDSANSTPAPSPRLPSTPFPLAVDDPFWIDKENYDTHAQPEPPYTPPPRLPTPPPGTPPAAPPSPPPLRRSTRILRPRQPAVLSPLFAPPNTVLYDLLGLESWDVTVDEIKNAYRAIVVIIHPDKVPEDQREAATAEMQKVNGAKEVLLDEQLRRKYHYDGELPWDPR